MTKARVQKFIAQSGICSRRKAEELIEQGRVLVNGTKAKLGDQCEDRDEIKVDGKKLSISKSKKYRVCSEC